ncbi:hypothetical protein A4H97_19185 [Niastella yeongjuensis]|uniref:TonB-dependent receptor n=1 Tax=Niastella yeongjuensis TaxID=354355 RepID=A0A1V9DYG2_9BACT|nr:hypothetical protein [Niastella yeongjuensis]OQP38839.1 hypothetical protein A4H97_19185 [Niastella yeongjuensis]SEO30631.1 hypothetical protein SAMN05660816_02564 [Niastella yeongjuensis]
MRINPFLPTVILISVATTGKAQTDSTVKTTNLKEVTVTGRKPLIEQKADRLIINVDAFISNRHVDGKPE